MFIKDLDKGAYGYLNKNKVYEWKKAAAMLSVPILIFIAAWMIRGTRLNIITVVSIVGCLPGCNQVVRAILASQYHSIDRTLYEETERARGEKLALYENVFTSYEENFYVDCIVISGQEIAGYTSNEKTDPGRAAAHLRKILKENSYKENVKIFKEKKAFLERVQTLAAAAPEDIPYKKDERYPEATRDELVQGLLMAISL